MDPVHEALRRCVLHAWTNLAGQQAFKNVAIDQNLIDWKIEGMATANEQISARLSCGDSANRMCEILSGSAMANIKSADNANAVDLSDDQRVLGALRSMKSLPGYILVRINVSGGAAGHAYIFLSLDRGTNDPLTGHIYQTNVGIHRDTAFGLKQWVEDPKSQTVVDLAEHFEELRSLCGIGDGPHTLPNLVYEKQFTLTDTPLKLSDALGIQSARQTGNPASVSFMWTPMNGSVLYKNVVKIRAITEAGQIKAQGTFF
ncbi:hypothetical protein RGUI_0737 [Rhodovulum sp. P5]|uniref:hypothetical protein n=1 Tax=Rhodovulum sp. P5 TaxID=1564506 RepID=UPI0009C34C85|nr:hypothetical protein [Rhodovulum sp. P5]ARE38878.1 hypothetical protein RGUI_0737 [Rhodovulum sp. P5]